MSIQIEIRKLVADNKLETALEKLIQFSISQKDTALQNDLITLQARFTRVKQQERLGIVNYTEALREQTFMASTILDMVQRLEAPSPIQPVLEDLPLDSRKTILFLASSPTNEAKLQLEKEFVRISQSLQDGVIEYRLVAEWAITPNLLQKAILKHKPNFVHFSGHGESGDEFSGGIVLQNSEAKAQLVSGKALANMFRIFSKKLNIEIVLLNSCYSDDQANSIGQYIPFVIGMNDRIEDDASIEFSTGFYRGLAEEDDVQFAFDLAVNMIQLEGLEDDAVPALLINPCFEQKK